MGVPWLAVVPRFVGENNRYVSNRTLVIDVGKNFLAAATEWFPKYGLREIDAVLITHAHADGGFMMYLLWMINAADNFFIQR